MIMLKAILSLAIFFDAALLGMIQQRIEPFTQESSNPFNDINISDTYLETKVQSYIKALKKDEIYFVQEGENNLKKIFTPEQFKNAQSYKTVSSEHQLFIPLLTSKQKSENPLLFSRFLRNMELAALHQNLGNYKEKACFYPNDMDTLFYNEQEKIKNKFNMEQWNQLKFNQHMMKATYNMFLCFPLDYLENIYEKVSIEKLCEVMIEDFAQQQKKVIDHGELKNKFNVCIEKVTDYMQMLEKK